MQLRSMPGSAVAGVALFPALLAEASFPVLSANAFDPELELHAETVITPAMISAMPVTAETDLTVGFFLSCNIVALLPHKRLNN